MEIIREEKNKLQYLSINFTDRQTFHQIIINRYSLTNKCDEFRSSTITNYRQIFYHQQLVMNFLTHQKKLLINILLTKF